MWTSATQVTCPSCYETFEVPAPAPSEVPANWDYDCEICCRPMQIRWVVDEEGHVQGEGYSLGDP